MNDTTRASRSIPDSERRRTLPTQPDLTGRHMAMDPRAADENSRWLNRLAAALAAGLILAEPRTALLSSAALRSRGTDRDRRNDL